MTPIQMAAKFHDARDTIRRLHPTDWHTHLDPIKRALRQIMERHGEDVIHATLRAAKRLREMGELEALTYWLAAAAEIAEPTP